ncbi:MAG: flap endonuclease-1 [Nanoarchaeota archaeon]|nr:flap endonuclease-1 [Nanoarchaeota archaeon]
MGVKLPGILPVKTISWEELKGKKIGIDFSNCAYQFLSSIRQRDGTPLMDSKGRVTSHLSGLFYRSSNLIQKGLKLCYIFDGKPPSLKIVTQEEREHRKRIAETRLEKAREEEDIEAMGKYSKQTTRMSKEIVKESKELLKAMGIPIIQSPSESDAQGSFMVENGDLDYFASSDQDCLLHNCPRLIPNLTLSQTRKVGGSYVYIQPQIIELEDVLNHLGIDRDRLIVMGILTGTDYNPKGIPGIGPKKALNLVKQFKKFDTLFKNVEADFNWKKIYAIFKSMPVMKEYQLKWDNVNESKIRKLLIKEHEFGEERVEKVLEKLKKKDKKKEQKGLGDFIK